MDLSFDFRNVIFIFDLRVFSWPLSSSIESKRSCFLDHVLSYKESGRR